MAIVLENEFVNVTPSTPSYPTGSFKAATAPNAIDGTPYASLIQNDWLGFFQAALAAASITPSGVADTALLSDYFEALQRVFQNQAIYNDESLVGPQIILTNAIGSSPLKALRHGQIFQFLATMDHDGPNVTVNVDGLGAKDLVREDGVANGVTNFIESGATYAIRYDADADQFKLIIDTRIIRGLSTGSVQLLYSSANARNLTIPDPGANATFVMSAGDLTIAGEKRFERLMIRSNFGGGVGNATVSYENTGASRTFTIQDPGQNADFVISEGTQTISGAKTFETLKIKSDFGANSGVFTFRYENTTLNKTYSIPTVTDNAIFILSESSQTVNGAKTFTSRTRFIGSGSEPAYAAGTGVTIVNGASSTDQSRLAIVCGTDGQGRVQMLDSSGAGDSITYYMTASGRYFEMGAPLLLSSGPDPIQVANGFTSKSGAKAWGAFSSAGTLLGTGFNTVAASTSGAGIWTIELDRDYVNTNYSAICSVHGNNVQDATIYIDTVSPKTVGSFTIRAKVANVGTNLAFDFATFGDQ